MDFVVTLAVRSDASAGRLERQTERGTVAIREVESPACADVAEALALSLELALEPASSAASEPPHATPVPSPVTAAALPEPAPVAALEPDRAAAPSVAAEPNSSVGLGAQGRLALGLGPALTPGLALFAELAGEAADDASRVSGPGRRSGR